MVKWENSTTAPYFYATLSCRLDPCPSRHESLKAQIAITQRRRLVGKATCGVKSLMRALPNIPPHAPNPHPKDVSSSGRSGIQGCRIYHSPNPSKILSVADSGYPAYPRRGRSFTARSPLNGNADAVISQPRERLLQRELIWAQRPICKPMGDVGRSSDVRPYCPAEDHKGRCAMSVRWGCCDF